MSWKSTIPEIPVVYFTSNYINSGLVKGLSFSNGFVHSDNLELDLDLDTNLDRGSYQEGCGHWLDLMRLHPSPKINSYAVDWAHVLDKHLFCQKPSLEGWDAERAYLNFLRSVAYPVGNVKPSWEHESLWARARKAANNLNMRAFLANRISPAPLHASSKTSSSAQSFRARIDSYRPDNSKPDKPFRGPNTTTLLNSPCFACGRRSHLSKDCHESRQENGRDIVIIRNERNNWVLPSGSPFCYPWNVANRGGCSGKECSKGKHVCSRCLSATHGARECPNA